MFNLERKVGGEWRKVESYPERDEALDGFSRYLKTLWRLGVTDEDVKVIDVG